MKKALMFFALVSFFCAGLFFSCKTVVHSKKPKTVKNDDLLAEAEENVTVSFETGGLGDKIEPQSVKVGEKAEKPAIPVVEDHNFAGWFEKIDGKWAEAEFDFETPIECDLTLYAKWEGLFSVSFETGGLGDKIEPQFVKIGEKVEKPAIPVVEDYNFAGWFEKIDGEWAEAEFDFETPIERDLTLYAKWKGLCTLAVAIEKLKDETCLLEDVDIKINEQRNNIDGLKEAIKAHTGKVRLDISEMRQLEKIDTKAFEDCETLANVKISDSVKSIGNYAFRHCKTLFEIEIPDGVESVGKYAFYGCTSLSGATVGNSVADIGDSTFSGCSALARIEIGEGVQSIGSNAFENCGALANVAIPDGVKSIGNFAFRGCKSLSEIEIPDGVAFVGKYAFWRCASLTSATVGNSVADIGDSTFSGCSSLAKIKIGEGVQSIGDYAFDGCELLAEIAIPDGVKSIGNYAFRGCGKVAEIEIPDEAKSIGNYAFSGCVSLTSAVIGNSVADIGDHAFKGCTSLAEIELGDNIANIGGYAFQDCKSLAKIELPDSVSSVGDYAFRSCKSLGDISFLGEVPPTFGENVFSDIKSTAKIYVPANAVEAYKEALGQNFAKFVLSASEKPQQ